jgi:hypothetical protein
MHEKATTYIHVMLLELIYFPKIMLISNSIIQLISVLLFSDYIFPSNRQEIIMNLPEIYRVWKIHWIVIWIDAFALHHVNQKN